MSRPAWRGVVVVVGLVPDDRAMRVIWRFRPADRANCNQSCGVVVARFSRVGQDGRNPWRCWIDLERLHHLSIYQATTGQRSGDRCVSPDARARGHGCSRPILVLDGP